MQIFACDLAGRTLVLDVEPSSTVAQIKGQIAAGVPLAEQLLSHAGRCLEDHDTLASLGIQQLSTLHQVRAAEERAGELQAGGAGAVTGVSSSKGQAGQTHCMHARSLAWTKARPCCQPPLLKRPHAVRSSACMGRTARMMHGRRGDS